MLLAKFDCMKRYGYCSSIKQFLAETIPIAASLKNNRNFAASLY